MLKRTIFFIKLLCIFSISLMLLGCGGGGSSGGNNQKEACIYFDNAITTSMIVGTWKHTKESNPEKYSELITVNKSPVNGYISKIQFKNDGKLIDTSCEMTIESGSVPIIDGENPPELPPYEWICTDDSPEIINQKYTVSGNRIYITDLNGNNAVSIHAESDGNILYFIVSQYTKQ